MRPSLFVLLSLLLALVASTVRGGDYLEREEVRALIDQLVDEEGIERERLEHWLGDARRQEGILEAIASPAERTLSWGEYRALFLDEDRIRQGVSFFREHEALFRRAEEETGVPAEIILAILGVETRYGRHKGTWRVVDALATLGFDYPPRASFFRGQLRHLFLLEEEAGIDPLDVTGSYAGAIGYPQFIPSSYRAYAVDFDGSGRIDLVNSQADAIGSIANYLAEHGWQQGLPVAARARTGDGGSRRSFDRDYNPRLRLGELEQKGATALPCSDENAEFCMNLPASTRVAALELDGAQGPEYWITTRNFYVITRYNHSELYAMAVYHLSRVLAGHLE